MPNNGFRISARTILQLGGELISSDGIAFYELIKNAVDADSPDVSVDVVSRLPFDAVSRARHSLEVLAKSKTSSSSVTEILYSLVDAVLPDAPGADELIEELQSVDDAEEAESLLDDANYITFRDAGHGMSLEDLKEVYLHVGTPSRLLEKQRGTGRRVLGEKGIGRLSVMRLRSGCKQVGI